MTENVWVGNTQLIYYRCRCSTVVAELSVRGTCIPTGIATLLPPPWVMHQVPPARSLHHFYFHPYCEYSVLFFPFFTQAADRWVDRWMRGYMDGWMDGWMGCLLGCSAVLVAGETDLAVLLRSKLQLFNNCCITAVTSSSRPSYVWWVRNELHVLLVRVLLIGFTFPSLFSPSCPRHCWKVWLLILQ